MYIFQYVMSVVIHGQTTCNLEDLYNSFHGLSGTPCDLPFPSNLSNN